MLLKAVGPVARHPRVSQVLGGEPIARGRENQALAEAGRAKELDSVASCALSALFLASRWEWVVCRGSGLQPGGDLSLGLCFKKRGGWRSQIELSQVLLCVGGCLNGGGWCHLAVSPCSLLFPLTQVTS